MPTAATTVATVVGWAIAAGIIAIGASVLWSPNGAAGFGIPGTRTADPVLRAWLSVKAVRDIGAGLLLLVVLVGGDTHLRGWMLLAGALMPLGDALIVRRSGGPAMSYAGVHGSTAAVMVAAGVVLLMS